MIKSDNCWEAENFFGYPLRKGVKIIALVNIILACLIIIVTYSQQSFAQRIVIGDPLMLHNLFFSMIASTYSVYQIIISCLLLWQTDETTGKIFFCSLWYISHIGIMIVYTMLYSSRAVLYYQMGQYFKGCFTFILGSTHVGAITRFCIVVNSFLHSLEMDRYM